MPPLCNTIEFMKKAFLFLLVFYSTPAIMAQNSDGNSIEVEIVNIESGDGKMMIGLYDSEENWLKKRVMSKIGQIKDGKSTVIFENVPYGTFAISSFHDKNDNGVLDTNFLGIPKEGIGSSNNAPARLGPPKWEDAKFAMNEKSIKQTIKL